MTAAGYTQVGKIYRYEQLEDDSIGGSVPTGTVSNEFVNLRISTIEPTMALLEQGLETPHFYRSAVSASGMSIRENDEIEVILPVTSWYFGYRFRVISVQRASLRPEDPRSQAIVVMKRLDIAHGKEQS